MLSGSAASRVFGVPYGTRAGNDGSARTCTESLINGASSLKRLSRGHRGAQSDSEGSMRPMVGTRETDSLAAHRA
jgi:hypothetical protein